MDEFVVLSSVFGFGQDLKVLRDVQTADVFRAKRHDMVDLVGDACIDRELSGFPIDERHGIQVAPMRGRIEPCRFS